MTADAPHRAFNVREGTKRLLIVMALASACSIGATTWAWFGKGGVVRSMASSEASLQAWGAAAGTVDEPATEDAYRADVRTEIRAGDRFLALRKWTLIGHLIAAAAGLLIWAMSGFVARQRVSLTIAADPPRQTGSADTGPPADTEG
jgi:hypothetical protein